MAVTQYKVTSDPKNKGKYRVQKAGVLLSKTLKSNMDYQAAIEYAKQLGDEHRGAQLAIYKSKNSLTKSWAYKKRTPQAKWNNKTR